MRKYLIPIFLLFPLFALPADAQNNLIQLKTVIHVSSVVSEGEYTLFEIAQEAEQCGINAVIFTDRDVMRWEYGLWPLRNVIKKRVEDKSIFTYGIRHYLQDIEELSQEFPEIIFIAGTESAPFYCWEGSSFETVSIQKRRATYQGGEVSKTLQELQDRLKLKREDLSRSLEQAYLKMYNWHQHILAIGLDNYQDYRNLPVIGNLRGVSEGIDILSVWPLFTLIFGLWYITKGIYFYTDHKGKHIGVTSKKTRIILALIVLVSFLFLLNNWPFRKLRFDQYHGDLGSLPYQNYIDYVNERGGVTFWVHPEAEYILEMEGVGFVTTEYSYRLLDTKGYTGFSIFPEGYQKIGKPGGVWDTLLLDYCRGIRENPVWAIGGLAFEKGNISESMKHLQTIVLVPEKSKPAVLEALKKGRAYVVEGKKSLDFLLENFSVSDEAGKVKGILGDEVKIEGRPLVYIEGGFLEKQQEVEIKIIKNGEVVKTHKIEQPFRVVYHDEIITEPSYYRLEIIGRGLHLVTNPIFVFP